MKTHAKIATGGLILFISIGIALTIKDPSQWYLIPISTALGLSLYRPIK